MEFSIIHTSYNLTNEELLKVYDKFTSIKANLEEIEDYSDTGYCPMCEGNVEKIVVDLYSAIDEFYIEGNFENNSSSLNINTIKIEVVTKEVAESNDIDFISDESEEDKQRYKLGEELSMYKPLGTSEYWYRLL